MKSLTTLFFFLFAVCLTAQDSAPTSVASSLNSIQANLGSVYFVHEKGFTDKFTVRLEAGVMQQFRFLSPDANDESYYGLRPVVKVTPRLYYNLEKRAARGRNTANNSGDFVGLTATYLPNFFVWNTNENVIAVNNFRAHVHWGLRRQLGKHFDFEFTAGFNLRPGGRILGQRSVVGLVGLPHVGWRFGYRF